VATISSEYGCSGVLRCYHEEVSRSRPSRRAAVDAQTKIEQPPNENRRELPLVKPVRSD
jgi:hypothetical protein